MQTLYFINLDGKTKRVLIYKDGSYRIVSDYGLGKIHNNFSEYYKNITEKGWKKSDFHNYLVCKLGWSKLYGKK